MKKLLARIAAAVLRRTKPTTELMQIHLSGSVLAEKDFFQVAQKRFAIDASPGERIEWLSQVIGKCSITNPRVDVLRESTDKLLIIERPDGKRHDGDLDPSFLTYPSSERA